MSLRARLAAAIAIVAVVLLVVVAAVTARQRDFLIAQLDATLTNSAPAVPAGAELVFDVGDETEPVPVGEVELVEDDGAGVMDIYVLWDDGNGSVVEAVGPFLEDRPDLTEIDIDENDAQSFHTVDGLTSSARFRVMVSQQPLGLTLIVASPLTDIEAAIDQLRWSLLGGSLVVIAILLLSFAWVSRLGIRPISEVTAAATAIGQGDRDRRVELYSPRTEAGRLAAAFNEMLDQRDVAEQRLRRFVADASHELRTPLTSVSGYLDLVADGVVDDERLTDMLRRARSESQRMCDLVEDLLLLAHLDEGRPMRSDPVDLGSVLVDIASDAAVTHPHRSIEVVVDGVTIGATTGDGERTLDVPSLEVVGDDYRLRQVVAGLVQNALVHTPPTASIWLRARRSGDSIVMSVVDDGPGLDDQAAATVFDRFARVDESRKRQSTQGGFGLGLAIAQAIVEAHGATIALDTAPGQGCEFIITFPAHRPSGQSST